MKKLVLTAVSMMLFFNILSQDFFEVKTIGGGYSLSTIQNSFRSSDFCGSFFETKRNVITLNDGSVIELKSKVELDQENIVVNSNCFLVDSIKPIDYIWSIHSTGRLLKGFDNIKYPTKKEYDQINNQ